MHNLLTREFISQHKEVARLIAEITAPEKIYILGCSISHVRTESIFAYNQPTARNVSHYYVLVLVSNTATAHHSLQGEIENNCRHFIPLTAIVLNIHHFNQWLTQGHPFANTVVQRAKCIHDAGNFQLVVSRATDEQQLIKTNESLYTTGLNKVQEFIAGADLYMLRQQNNMAALMLHQATEQALHTLFRIRTGLYIHTHNLDKLFRYCSMVSYKLPAIFMRNNDKNERLFHLLQKAYIGSRYNDDYNIHVDDLLILSRRVGEVKKLLEESNAR